MRLSGLITRALGYLRSRPLEMEEHASNADPAVAPGYVRRVS